MVDGFGDDDDDFDADNDALEVEAVPHDGDDDVSLDPAELLGAVQKADDQPLPEVAVALPINQRPIFPLMTLPLVIPEGPLAAAVKYAIKKHEWAHRVFHDQRNSRRWRGLFDR